MPELNGFPTGRKKKTSESLDELDRSLEGIETGDPSFEKGMQNFIRVWKQDNDVGALMYVSYVNVYGKMKTLSKRRLCPS
jgi:hypothetical protein